MAWFAVTVTVVSETQIGYEFIKKYLQLTLCYMYVELSDVI